MEKFTCFVVELAHKGQSGRDKSNYYMCPQNGKPLAASCGGKKEQRNGDC